MKTRSLIFAVFTASCGSTPKPEAPHRTEQSALETLRESGIEMSEEICDASEYFGPINQVLKQYLDDGWEVLKDGCGTAEEPLPGWPKPWPAVDAEPTRCFLELGAYSEVEGGYALTGFLFAVGESQDVRILDCYGMG
jgi:hypothetical protein